MEDEFVVCPSCGTRIKAGREFCLRCFEPLPTPDRPVRPPIWVSFGLSETKVQAIVIAVGALVVGLGVVIYLTEPPAVDETARPAVSATPRPAPAATAASSSDSTTAAPAASATVSGAASFEPTITQNQAPADRAALDAKRVALEAELGKRPNDAPLLNDLGLVLDQLGRSADAISFLERAVALDASQLRFHMNLAHAAMGAGLWDRAIGELREATRLKPDDHLAQYMVGLTFHKKGDDQSAIPEFQRTLAIAPNDASAHLSLAVSLEAVGRVDEAIPEYRRFLQLQPNSVDAPRLREHLQAIGAGTP